ncbi:hypothetical protein PENANT_c003G04131 [Penicillium antarcticum]|uniref:Uncharacterized protein n=1 Tax=Penicillium antarcticum TaxID=416450 RepID=A0A1V6QIC8_9EURO|nr:hypothetical protein PENANT_c003G04131 [Penicillium antarcticum]
MGRRLKAVRKVKGE